MKEEILSIASDLREGFITSNEAKDQLLLLFDVRERLINYLNGRIRLIQSKYEMDEFDERIIDEIVDIRTDIQNNSF